MNKAPCYADNLHKLIQHAHTAIAFIFLLHSEQCAPVMLRRLGGNKCPRGEWLFDLSKAFVCRAVNELLLLSKMSCPFYKVLYKTYSM